MHTAFAADAASLPRLCFLGYRHLREFSAPVLDEYRDRADIELLDATVDGAVALARERIQRGGVEAFVSGGANGGMLRQQLRAPVATVQLDGIDVLQALIAARQHSTRVGVIVYGQTLPELDAIKGLLKIELQQHAYRTPAEAQRGVDVLHAGGFQVVVGTSLAVEMAEAAGLTGVMAYSLDSIRRGFDEAIELVRAARQQAGRPLHRRQPAPACARHHFEDLEGQSPDFLRAVDTARRFARTDLTILVTGESGTGKELFAQAIHNASPRSAKPFVAINCAAFPESLLESELFGYEEGAFTGARRGGKRGLFEAAHGGTVFLDEIGDMPLSLQTRLLRVLQEREVQRIGSASPTPVDLRVIAATHQPLAEMVAQGRFRQDLFFRINTLRLGLPSLRARAADVIPMAERRVRQCLARLQVRAAPGELLAAIHPLLQGHGWPGNVRELENICERLAVFMAQFSKPSAIDWSGLPHECPELFEVAPATAGPAMVADRAERARRTLEQHFGNHQAAALALGVSRSTLWRWLRSTA
ncbi:propionate catabolism operon regulatory protein PrpR [Xylophilus rhododendri]|uniref:Propionate catabolism operon regulatory protein PrpR n=1 Tax=Xylophilus rhododendri TaxID=2697032 RepID=A0A857JAY2_9BURK|nr:propionate catabolism operon regulatory protein PrpR [Xylophilus rhododendri]QHI99898.1 propionate catabolism operon regulatory protein PrpR [Xylophilus rhododendri]